MLARVRYEIGRRRPRNQPQGSAYRKDLLRLLHQHLKETTANPLPLDAFISTAEQLLESDDLKQTAIYLSKAWELLHPDFRDHLSDYYNSLSALTTLGAINYAGSERFIDEHYGRPYAFANDRHGPLRVLEIGSGIPHGLIRTQQTRPDSIVSATLVDIDAPYTRFAIWYCRTSGIACEWVPAEAGLVAPVPRGAFNFVFAKDVFEHVGDPGLLLDHILRAVADSAILALDIEDKGAIVHQHVSPQLGHLAKTLGENGWANEGKMGNLTIFAR